MIRKLLPYAATALVSVAAATTYLYGGPVHALGLAHSPGGCEPCTLGYAQTTLQAVSQARQAQAAPVGSAQ